MQRIRFGRTGLQVSRIGFGALQIAAKYDYAHAERLLNAALDAGINIIDTARGYQDSEERIGKAISHRRDEFVIATKSGGGARKDFWEALEESLRCLKTDHIDIYQFHGADSSSRSFIYEGERTIECMWEAREQGKIQFISFSSHSLEGSLDLMATGDFDVLQYPISYVGSEATERGLVEEAERLDIGLLGMKPFGGGRLGRARHCLGYVFRFPWVVPVIGFETIDELTEALALAESGVELTAEELAEMDRIKGELGERFCRGCNYCHPCPQGIPVLEVMFFDVFRKQLGEDWVARDAYRKTIASVAACEECGTCVSRCPFDLEVPAIMRDIVGRYQQMMTNRG